MDRFHRLDWRRVLKLNLLCDGRLLRILPEKECLKEKIFFSNLSSSSKAHKHSATLAWKIDWIELRRYLASLCILQFRAVAQWKSSTKTRIYNYTHSRRPRFLWHYMRIFLTDYVEAIIIIHRMAIQHLCVFSRLHILSLSTTVIFYILAQATLLLPRFIRTAFQLLMEILHALNAIPNL